MNQLKQVYAFFLRNGYDESHTITLILNLLQISQVSYAHKLFDQIPQPTLSLYNKLLQAYISTPGSEPQQCFSLYAQMCQRALTPNERSFTLLFSACSSLCSPHLGQAIHSHLIRFGCNSDVFASTALVDMYGKLGLVGNARRQFDEMEVKGIPTWNSMIAGYCKGGYTNAAKELFWAMPARSVVSWTSMISGYAQNGDYLNALEMFFLMEKQGDEELKPNEVTIASVLSACANLGSLEVGERVYDEYVRRNGYLESVFVCNALLEMYAKCGRLDRAEEVFDLLGSKRMWNLCSWNSMVMGLAVHGRCKEALSQFDQMLEEGIIPDDVSFVGALMACAHGGMIREGWKLFVSMEKNFKVTPKLEHYGCMVDLLGRAGKVDEAYSVIKTLPMKPDSVIWGALLGACSFRGNVKVAEVAANSLLELEPWNPGNYVILSNIYASQKRWNGVARMRKMMKGGQITKAAGYSLIEVDGEVYKFIVEDNSHPRSVEIYRLLKHIRSMMKSESGDKLSDW